MSSPEESLEQLCRDVLAAAKKSPFDVLSTAGEEVLPTSSYDTARRAYLKLVSLLHPDKSGGETLKAFQAVTASYRNAADPEFVIEGWQEDEQHKGFLDYDGQWYQDIEGIWFTDYDYRDVSGKWQRRTTEQVKLIIELKQNPGRFHHLTPHELQLFNTVSRQQEIWMATAEANMEHRKAKGLPPTAPAGGLPPSEVTSPPKNSKWAGGESSTPQVAPHQYSVPHAGPPAVPFSPSSSFAHTVPPQIFECRTDSLAWCAAGNDLHQPTFGRPMPVDPIRSIPFPLTMPTQTSNKWTEPLSSRGRVSAYGRVN